MKFFFLSSGLLLVHLTQRLMFLLVTPKRHLQPPSVSTALPHAFLRKPKCRKPQQYLKIDNKAVLCCFWFGGHWLPYCIMFGYRTVRMSSTVCFLFNLFITDLLGTFPLVWLCLRLLRVPQWSFFLVCSHKLLQYHEWAIEGAVLKINKLNIIMDTAGKAPKRDQN